MLSHILKILILVGNSNIIALIHWICSFMAADYNMFLLIMSTDKKSPPESGGLCCCLCCGF